MRPCIRTDENPHWGFQYPQLICLCSFGNVAETFSQKSKDWRNMPLSPQPPPHILVKYGSVSFTVLSIHQSSCLSQSSPKDFYKSPCSHSVPLHFCIGVRALTSRHDLFRPWFITSFSWQFLGYKLVCFSYCSFCVQLHCLYVFIPPICLFKAVLRVCILFLII